MLWKNNSCSNRSHLPQCFIKALRFLLAWLLCFYTEIPRIFFWKAIFATSPIVPAVTIHNLPWKMRVETCALSFQYGILPSSLCLEARSLCVVCGLLAMFRNRKSLFGNPHISPFNILSCSACWSKKQDAGIETSHAKRIFSDYVTCFGKNNSCSNRSHLPQCFIKALSFLLAWLLCFYTEIPRIFFWKAIFATSPIVPAVIIHTLPWKMRVETCPLSFQYGILPGSFPFRAWCGDFQALGDVSAQKLCQASGDFSLEQVGFDVSAPCTHDSNSIDVYTATHARGSRKVQEDRWRSRCPVCGLLAMFRNRKWLLSDLPISVRTSANIALQFLIMQRLLVEETRCWNGD